MGGPGSSPAGRGTEPAPLSSTEPLDGPGEGDVATDGPAAGGGAGGDGEGAAAAAETADVVIDTALPVALTRTLIGLGSDPQYPIAVLVVVLVFLLVQHGIDARDPKLAAAAATQRDNELSFEDPFAPNGPGPTRAPGRRA